jgi:hypothetical protein
LARVVARQNVTGTVVGQSMIRRCFSTW